MTPIRTEHTNLILKGPKGGEVQDLPAVKVQFEDGSALVESCWQLSAEELEEINKTGVVYFLAMGHTHPPILLSTSSVVDEEGGDAEC